MALLTKSLCFYQVYREMWLAKEEIGGDFHSRSTPLLGKDGTAAWYTQSPSWPSRSATLDVGVEDVAVCAPVSHGRGSQCMRADESK
jgi:hypothetical protein